MKKSVIIFMHIFFWIAILATRFISPILARFLSPLEYGQIANIIAFFPPVFFYVGYIGIMKIKWGKNSLLLSLLTVVSIYLILFFFSKKVFAYA